MKRLLAALLTLSMLVGIVPFSAFAESPGAVPETFAAAQESPGLDDETVQSIVSDPLLQGQYTLHLSTAIIFPLSTTQALRRSGNKSILTAAILHSSKLTRAIPFLLAVTMQLGVLTMPEP